jgi:hypothetical protein
MDPTTRGARVDRDGPMRSADDLLARRRLILGGMARLRVLGLALLAVVVAIAAQQVVVWLHRPLLVDDFNRPDGLVTNEFAYFNPHDRAAVRSPIWIATSGSLFVRDNAAWTGVPDRGVPGPRSATRTDSSVFRIVTRRANFQNVTVSFSLLIRRFMPASSGPTPGWQGVHVFLRYQSPDLLYVVSVDRVDGVIVMKKKVPGGSSGGGTYYTLVKAQGSAVSGRWEHVRVSAVNDGEGGVRLLLWLNGRLRLQAVDNGIGDTAPITQPGRVGIRGDYTEFMFDDFTVAKP